MNKLILREWQLFLLSISIFTRIPVPASLPYSEDLKNESYKYCGLVGLVIGTLTSIVFYIFNTYWSVNVAVAISMAFSVYITGAFHEDGFADTCDGLGGGFTPERKLEIMKDSRVGAYGVLGIVLILLTKFALLTSTTTIYTLLIVGHVMSRAIAVSFVFTHNYVRQTSDSKLNTAKSNSSVSDLFTIIVITMGCSLFFLNLFQLLVIVSVILVLRWVAGRWMVSQIGGYTGDVLGAIQQAFEIVCYLTIIAIVGQ